MTDTSPPTRTEVRNIILIVLGAIGLVVGAMWWIGRSVDQAYFREFVSFRTQQDLTALHEALAAYAQEHGGEFPSELNPLVMPDARGHRYLFREELPLDPWNRPYVFVRGTPPNVLTLGADGKPGGTGDDADIDYASIVNGR